MQLMFKMEKPSISARLKPDFDPKYVVLNSYPAKSTEQLRAETKTASTFIYDYLIITLDFLQSDQKELPFPNLARTEEEFFVKLNERKLNISNLNQQCLKAVNKILEVVERNKNVYRWTHIYKENKLKKFLVYKKLAICQPKPCPTPTTMHTLASDFQDMCLQDRQDVKPSFKTAILNTTLKFIKDPAQLTLEYPKMSLHEAQFLYNLLHSNYQTHSDLGFGFKSIYSSLHDAIEKLNESYALKFDFIKTSELLTSQFVLKKVPKKQKRTCGKEINNNISQDPNGIIPSSKSSDLKPSTKPQLTTKERIVKSLTETFIKSSLEKFLAFIEDEYMASLEFKAVSVTESRFLECLMSMCQSELYAMFSPDCEVLLKRIHRATRRAEFALQRSVGKLCRRTETRNIVFFKTPSYDTPIAKEAIKNVKNVSLVQPITKKDVTSYENVKPIIKGERSNVLKDQTRKIERAMEETSPIALEETSPSNIDVKIVHPSIKEATPDLKSSEQPTSNVKFYFFKDEKNYQCGSTESNSDSINQKTESLDCRTQPINSSVDSDSTPDVKAGGVKSRASPPPVSRQGRLLKALSTPVAGGLAERMMRKMGWQGGGLGSRGEGVLEPIMPAIHLKPGAGLGHVNQSPPSAVEPRDKLLRNVLTFAQSSAEDTVISLPQAMSDKQSRFFRYAVEGFNDRRIVGLTNKDEVDLIRRIVEEITKNPRLYIGYQINDERTKLRLVKVNGPVFVKKTGKKKAKSQKALTTDTDIITVVDDIEELCPTRKAAERLAYKLKFLEKICEFLASKNTEAECKFDCVLSKKQKEYIQKTIADVNRGVSSVSPNNSELENDMFREIRRAVNAASGSYITITFDSQSFKLRKKTTSQNKTNCISSLPPPKSKDLKNTIVYLPKQHT